MDNRDNIIEKIRKCLELAKSGSEHEAAAALRQATKLMELHKVSQAEMLAAGVSTAHARSGALERPASWEDRLAGSIARVFGCRLIHSSGFSESHWLFIGIAPANTVAAYSFEVLFRQARKARQSFMSSELRRFKRSNKVRRADLFSDAWVQSACRTVAALTPVEGAEEAIAAYVELKYPELGVLQPANRNKGRELDAKDQRAYAAGLGAGRNAQLHQGVGADASPLMLEG